MNLMDQTNGSAPLPKADITELDDEAAQMNGETKQNGLPDGETEAEDVPLRPEEKRRLNWDGELYMAPMCTVGNLVSLLSQLPIWSLFHPRCPLCAIQVLINQLTFRSPSVAYALATVLPSHAPRWPSPNRLSRVRKMSGP